MTLIYQAYDQIDPILQTQFSIVSLLKVLTPEDDLKIVVYTDKMELLKKFFGSEPRVQLKYVSKEQLTLWRGKINFFHRVKIEILKDAAQNFPGTLLYADGDTFFKSSPRKAFALIDSKTSLMHLAENTLRLGRDPLSKKLKRFVRKHQFVVRGQKLDLGPDTMMWNAGVIGLAHDNKYILDDMLDLTDKMYTIYPKHTIEQLAVSYFLGRHTQIKASDDEIYHYWNQKPEYQLSINSFFQKFPTLSEALPNYSQFVFPPPPKPRMSSFKKLKVRLSNRWMALFLK